MSTSDRRVPTGERALRKRAAITEAARKAFLERGFGVGVDQIAAEAGVSKVTVYNHFNSKEELFHEVVGDALEVAFGAAESIMRDHLQGARGIREVLAATARSWVEGVGHPDVLALRALIANESRRFPDLGRAWREQGPDRFAQPIAKALSECDELRIPDMDLAIIQFYALVLYPHIVHSGYGERLASDTAESLITTGVDMFLAYYRAA